MLFHVLREKEKRKKWEKEVKISQVIGYDKNKKNKKK